MALVHAHFRRLAHTLVRQLGLKADPSLFVIDYPVDRPSAESEAELQEKADDVVRRIHERLEAQLRDLSEVGLT